MRIIYNQQRKEGEKKQRLYCVTDSVARQCILFGEKESEEA